MSLKAAAAAPRHRRRARFLVDLAVVLVVTVLASLLIKQFLIESFFIPTASMENTLLGEPGHHDRILVNRLVPSLIPVERGDIIVFKDPGGWLTGEPAVPSLTNPVQQALGGLLPFATDDDYLVKRVIGLPGDRVSCCDRSGRMAVNGTPITEPYAVVPAGFTAVSLDSFDVTVPPGRLWVMGDNRYNSKDSRYQRNTPSKGFVPLTDVTGRAFVISWPIDRWRWLGNSPQTFATVAPAAH